MSETVPNTIRRILLSELNKTQDAQVQLLKSIDAKLTVAIAKIHNLGVESVANEKATTRLVAILAECLETDTQTQGEALAVVKDFLFQVTKKKL